MSHTVFIDSTVAGFNAFQTAKRLGHEVTFIRPMHAHSFVNMMMKDSAVLEPFMSSIDHYIEAPDLEDATLYPLLDELARTHPFHAVVSTTEPGIMPAALACARYNLPHPSPEVLANAVYKDRCRSTLAAHGIRSPRFEVLEESELVDGPRSIALPFVVKPVRGFGKFFSAICRTQQDYASFLTALAQNRERSNTAEGICAHEYIIEEYVVGSLHSGEAVVCNGEVMLYATTTRHRAHYYDLLELAAVMPSGLPQAQRDEMQTYLQSVFSALQIRVGLYHVEFLMSESGPVLVEINARMMGSVSPIMYKYLTGRDAYEHMLRSYLGEPVTVSEEGFHGAGITLAVAARHGGVVPLDFSQERFDALLAKYEIPMTSIRLRPGQQVARYEGNASIMGHVICLDKTPEAVTQKGHAFLNEIDLMLGIETAKYFDDLPTA